MTSNHSSAANAASPRAGAADEATDFSGATLALLRQAFKEVAALNFALDIDRVESGRDEDGDAS